jgi:uncharacterized metal-binding protein
MPELPHRKVGIVACSGEEMAEGTVTRQAALKVLEELRPSDTVTICLPLFLAGGEGDRAFARFYPTIALDGCAERCAARATAMYSSEPAASVVVSDLVAERGLARPSGCRHLDAAGQHAVEATAERVAGLVDELLARRWSRRRGEFEDQPIARRGHSPIELAVQQPANVGCACATAVPVGRVEVGGAAVSLAALPLIFEAFRQGGKRPNERTGRDLLGQVGIYNPIPADQAQLYQDALLREYERYCRGPEKLA